MSHVYGVDIVDSLNKKYFDLCHGDKLNKKDFIVEENLQKMVFELEALKPQTSNAQYVNLSISHMKLPYFVLQAPKVELKLQPEHLKYVLLGEEKTLLVIIANKLSRIKEDNLIRVLSEHKEAVGWTMTDIKGI